MVCLLEPFSSIGIFSAQVPEGAVPRTDPPEGSQKRRSRADQGLHKIHHPYPSGMLFAGSLASCPPAIGEARPGVSVSLSLTSPGERFVFVDW